MPSPKDDDNDQPLEDDIHLRIQMLRQQAAALNGGILRGVVASDCPAELEEAFWKSVIAFEHAPEIEPFEVLVKAGLNLTPPDQLDDRRLTTELWDVIRALAVLDIYLLCTDHLSDAQLYRRIWNEVLHEPAPMLPDDAATYIDLCGSGSEEDIEVYLKYYADDDERQGWAEDFPGDPVPDRAPLPFDRDRHLPQSFLNAPVRRH